MDAFSTHKIENVIEVASKYITLESDIQAIHKAYEFALSKHEGQFRKSGEPYVTHLVEVAYILADLHVGPSTIVAGLLHDTLEDTETSLEELTNLFGADISKLVEAVTKIQLLSRIRDEEFVAEGHRKIFIAMAKDIRVILIKLADRLHNMRTLMYQPPEKQLRISKETLDVYAPIAHRLGIARLKSELEDLSLFYLEPEKFKEIDELEKGRIRDREKSMVLLKKKVVDILLPTKIPFEITSRIKSIYSVYKKIYVKGRQFDEIYDIMAMRIITKTELNCYEILGYIHAQYKPIPGRFKDYIAMPKPNMYQSLHTTIVTNDGQIFEIQIRTAEMDEIAESGVAAHWRYKEGKAYDPKVEQKEIEEKLHWFRDLISITKDNKNEAAKEYMDSLTHDIFDANVYCFTPRGRVIDLPAGATPIDFAYKVHTKVGDSMTGALVNNVLVALNTTLKTGDVVEIRTSANATGPNASWLKIAKSNIAISHIKKFLLRINKDFLREDSIERGKNSISDCFKDHSLRFSDFEKAISKELLEHYRVENIDDFYVAVASRNIVPSQVIDFLKIDQMSKTETIEKSYKEKELNLKKITSTNAIYVENGENTLISLAACCSPIPGDPIVGYISKGNGIKVHCADCLNIAAETSRLIEVAWNPNVTDELHSVDLAVECDDRNNLLIEILNMLAHDKIKVNKVSAKDYPETNMCTINLTIMVKNAADLDKIKGNIRDVESVLSISRVRH